MVLRRFTLGKSLDLRTQADSKLCRLHRGPLQIRVAILAIPLAFIVSFTVGFIMGLINGIVVIKSRVTSFIITLGFGSVYKGIALL